MDKKRQQIQINEDNLDQFLQIDLRRTFNEIQKEKYDNNFDLERQFRLERDRSRNFRIYGRLSSTIIDCADLTLEIYSDPDYNDLYATTQSSLVGFNTDNVFRRKDGKYLIELNNYPFDVAYIRIASDDFFYEDQLWEQRLVFFDSEGSFVSYGTDAIDLDVLGVEGSVTVNNDFPFFFNKHWIRRDLNLKEEKPREISFSSTGNELLEGQVLDMQIFLNEPSPFGNETCIFNMSSPSMNFPYYFGQVASVTLGNEDGAEGILFRNDGGNLAFYTAVYDDIVDILFSQPLVTIQNGDYAGTYQALNVEEVVFDGIGDNPDFVRYKVVLDTPYIEGNQNADNTFSSIITYYLGDAPDISVSLNGEPILFPYNMSWEENEQTKQLQVFANDDFQVELREEFTFSFEERFRLEEGLIPVSSIFVVDNTPKGIANFTVEGIYKNRLYFEGRRARLVYGNTDLPRLYSSPSVLRNGAIWQGINQEFYPTESLQVVIKNRGQNTVIPVNPALDVQEEFVLLSGEEVELNYDVKYNNFVPMKVRATYTGGTEIEIDNFPNGEFLVNGVPLPVNIPDGGNFVELFPYFPRYKSRLDGGVFDYFNEQQLEKDFSVVFDDGTDEVPPSMIFTASDGGTFLNIEITLLGWVVEVLTPFTENPQIPLNFSLYSNTTTQRCAYDISFKKNGYRTLTVPAEQLETSEDGIQYYLNNVIGDVLAPYDQEQDTPFYINRSIYEGGQFFGIGNVVPNSEDILVTINEEEGEQGYGGTVMPLADKVYTNHAILLSENSLPDSRTNLTTYGRFNSFGELIEPPFWSTTPVTPIQSTVELTVSEPTQKVIDIFIPQATVQEVDGNRSFDFAVNSNEIFGVNKVAVTAVQFSAADQWWTNGAGVKVSNPDNNELYEGFPSLQEAVETGDEDGNLGGLVTGTLIDPDRLRLKSNFSAQDFGIQNVVQFTQPEEESNLFDQFVDGFVDFIDVFGIFDEGSSGVGGFNFVDYDPNMGYTWASPNSNTDDSYFIQENELAIAGLDIADAQLAVLKTYIRQQTVVPNLLVGDLNIGRNGLGGFSFTN